MPKNPAYLGQVVLLDGGSVKLEDGTTILAVDTDGSLTTPNQYVWKAGKTANGGGNATVAITVSGVLTTDVVFAQIQASTNAVTIQKVTPTANTITVLCSGDPGAATTIAWQVLRDYQS